MIALNKAARNLRTVCVNHTGVKLSEPTGDKAIDKLPQALELDSYKSRVIAAVTEAATKTHMNIHMLAEVRQAILNVNLGDCDD